MSIIDVEKLLAPVDGATAVGINLDLDPSMTEIEQIAAGKPEQGIGDTVIAAEEPDWKELKNKCIEALTRTKDLRIGMHLLTASMKIEGLTGFRDGLGLLRGMLEKYWETVHPQLDPEDGNDPLLRMNIISTLTDPGGFGRVGFFRRLKEMPLTKSPMVGAIAYKDIEIATGEVPPPENPPADARKMDATLVGAAFKESPTDFLKEELAAADAAIEHVKAIDAFLTKTVGASRAINFKELEALIKKMKTPVANALADRGEGSRVEAGGDGAGGAATGGGSGAAITGDVRTPQDVIRLIDKIVSWYEMNEPSSPVPLLLKRAQRLVSKNFLEVIKDLTPDTLRAIEALGGIKAES